MGPDDQEAREFGAESSVEDLPEAPTPVNVEPANAESHGRKVRTVWPYGEFHVEDVPTVNNDGVELNDSDLNTVLEAAKASGVKVRVEGDN
jgi:hypothetical protein